MADDAEPANIGPMPQALPNLEYTISGNAAGPTLVFIHGWPDDAGLWRSQVAALGSGYRCVLLTLPNFGAEPIKAGGFEFAELVAMLAATVEAVLPGGAPVTLVTHDWGAYLGYLFEQAHPDRVERMVALDIGGHLAPGSARERMVIAGYQWVLILFWLIGGVNAPLGDWLTQWFAARLQVPPRQAGTAKSRFNYPYFYLWRGMLLPRYRGQLLTRYRPRCPVLFIWGERKPVMFHSDRWLEIVAQSGGRGIGLDGAGHWFMETHPEETNRLLSEWLEASNR
jgi:pimeloyl-ACP methyl ester carboxylesterase